MSKTNNFNLVPNEKKIQEDSLEMETSVLPLCCLLLCLN